MSLDAWEQDALSAIADGLAASAPELASRLSVFNRLTCGEQMPEGLRAKGEGRRGSRRAGPLWGGPARRARRLAARRCAARAAPGKAASAISVAAVLALTAIVVAAALALSTIGTRPGGVCLAGHCRRQGGDSLNIH